MVCENERKHTRPHGGVDGKVQDAERTDGDDERRNAERICTGCEEEICDFPTVGKREHADDGSDETANDEWTSSTVSTCTAVADSSDDRRDNETGHRACDPHAMTQQGAGHKGLLEVRRDDSEFSA